MAVVPRWALGCPATRAGLSVQGWARANGAAAMKPTRAEKRAWCCARRASGWAPCLAGADTPCCRPPVSDVRVLPRSRRALRRCRRRRRRSRSCLTTRRRSTGPPRSPCACNWAAMGGDCVLARRVVTPRHKLWWASLTSGQRMSLQGQQRPVASRRRSRSIQPGRSCPPVEGRGLQPPPWSAAMSANGCKVSETVSSRAGGNRQHTLRCRRSDRRSGRTAKGRGLPAIP